MDASSTRRARLARLALCTAAVLAVAAFTGEARADNGLSALVSDTVSGTVFGTVEQLPSPAAEPLAEVVSTVAPTVDAAVPPVVDDEVVADATQLTGEVAGPAIPGLLEQAGSSPNESGTGTAPGPGATSTPEAAAPAEVAAPIAAETPTASAAGASPQVVRASPAAAPPARTAAHSPRSRADGTRAPLSQVTPVAPIRPVVATPVADSQPAHALPASSSPVPASSELPGFDALLPPLAAFALLLALPLGLFALTALSALGAGMHPAVALLRSADVHFRLVRPG